MGGKGKLSIRDIHICFVLYKSLEELRVTQCLLQNDYSTGFKAIYLTFLKYNIYISERNEEKKRVQNKKIGRFFENRIIS